jgi:hypothetical protein
MDWLFLGRGQDSHPYSIKGLKKAKAELPLRVLSCNLKRIINIQGGANATR